MAPTRELAEQIHREVERLCYGKRLKICLLKKDTVNGGGYTNLSGDKSAFRAYDIIVSTPMRLLGLVRARAIDLSGVRFIALDEADKLFELNKRGKKDDTTTVMASTWTVMTVMRVKRRMRMRTRH